MNKENMKPIDYACCAVDTMMRKFEASELPPKGRFHYHQGVFLSGVYQTYELCNNEAYFNYVKDWVDSIVDADGNVNTFSPGQLDDIQPANLLISLYEKVGGENYITALHNLMKIIKDFPRNEVGGFWHKDRYPNQMWLDGLYMAGPLSAKYGSKFDKPEFLECAIEQALLMQEKTRDPKTGLWYHAWDCSKKVEWADKETGLAPEFWGRSIGWVPVAVLEELEYIPEDHPKYADMCKLVSDLLIAVCKYQSEEGRWYQVVDKGDAKENWLENSCSMLFVATIYWAIRKGILDKEYEKYAKKGYDAIIKSLTWIGEDIQIGEICIGTGVGDFKHYCERPTSTNDLHGVGAFLIMCVESQKYQNI